MVRKPIHIGCENVARGRMTFRLISVPVIGSTPSHASYCCILLVEPLPQSVVGIEYLTGFHTVSYNNPAR